MSTKPPVEVFPLREREGVDEDVEVVGVLAPAREDALDVGVRLDVARLDERRADQFGEWSDALVDQAFDRRESDVGALRVQRLGDAPRDRVVVGDPEHERVLAVEQTHPNPPFR